MKKYILVKNIFIKVLLTVFFWSAGNCIDNLYAQTIEDELQNDIEQHENRRLEIRGTRLFTHEQLVEKLRLKPYLKRPVAYQRLIINRISAFYRNKGYSLVKVYRISQKDNKLKLFVDEGMLEKVFFHNANVIDISRLRYELDLPEMIYHPAKVKKESRRLRKEFNYRSMRYELKRTDHYNDAEFQIDRDLNIPLIDEKSVGLVNDFAPRYELHFYIEKNDWREQGGFHPGLGVHFRRGFLPYAEYLWYDLIEAEDQLEAKAQIGIMYGLDGKFGSVPRFTMAEAKADYQYKPLLDKKMVPMARGYYRLTVEDRKDLGLKYFDFTQIYLGIGPGFNLLKTLELHLGYGVEAVWLGRPRLDEDEPVSARLGEYLDFQTNTFKDDTDKIWNILEAELLLNFNPLADPKKEGWQAVKRSFSIGHHLYFNNTQFSKIFLMGFYDLPFSRTGRYTVKADHVTLTEDAREGAAYRQVPFYYEERVTSRFFKGFVGRSYHTRSIWRLSNEVNISLLREVIHGGIYLDVTSFEGSTYDLSGAQQGFVAGIATHFLLFSQLELNVYLGQDYLVQTSDSQFNVYLHAHLRR